MFHSEIRKIYVASALTVSVNRVYITGFYALFVLIREVGSKQPTRSITRIHPSRVVTAAGSSSTASVGVASGVTFLCAVA